MTLTACALICGGLYFSGRYLTGSKGSLNEGSNPKIAGFAVLGTILVSFLTSQFGPKVPGSWFERSEYSAELYVNLFPQEGSPTNYRVPALIKSEKRESTVGDESFVDRVYTIVRADFPGPGHVSFGDLGEQIVFPGTRTSVTDNSGRKWHVELTSEQVRK